MMQSGPSNRIAAHWARKIANRKARTSILDTGATSGAGRPEDAELFENTGQPSTKVFMLPNKSKVRATHKMLLKHKIREGAREMNIVPGLHSTLVSVPKMVDEDYIVVFDKSQLKLMTQQQPRFQQRKTARPRSPQMHFNRPLAHATRCGRRQRK